MEFVKLVGPAGVFFIMFALGLNLTIRNFVKVFKSFENLIVGLICQIIILPIIGLILISLIDLTPEFQFGIFLLLIMPSAAMSNYATKLVNGNVSLSITLTSLCALLSCITVPLYLNLFGKYIYEDFFDLNLITFSIKTFLFITMPVFIGIYCREKFSNFLHNKQKEMYNHANNLEFEDAAKIRDQINELQENIKMFPLVAIQFSMGNLGV